MAHPPSLNSNNPFRRKAAASSGPAPPPAPPQLSAEDGRPSSPNSPAANVAPADRFRSQLQALSASDQPPPATSFQKPKVVKRVRVQSPPPSSPESPGLADHYPPVHRLDDDSGNSSDDAGERADPFTIASSTASADLSDSEGEPQPETPHRPPPNPFQRTLRDLELGPAELEHGSVPESGTRGPLDVSAFGRLLLTGQTGGDGASSTDKSSISRRSTSDSLQAVQETSQSSRETSEPEVGDDGRGGLTGNAPSSLQPAPTFVKQRPPPPPSSRHGKRISNIGGEPLGANDRAQAPVSHPPLNASMMPLSSTTRQSPPTPSDVNKPLPPVPHRSPAEEAAESVFDREAAGKIPEPDMETGLNIIMPPRPPTPPNVSHAAVSIAAAGPQQQSSRKPAPPPRRQPHGRAESKINSVPVPVPSPDGTDSPNRRSSLDSTRSRSSSLRASVHAPAPPPPRRPSHPPRASSSFSAPLSAALSGAVTPTIEHPQPRPQVQPTAADPLQISRGPVVASPPPIIGDENNPSSSAGSGSGSTTAVPPANPSVGSKHASSASLPYAGSVKLASPPPPPPARNASMRGKRPATSGGAASSTSDTGVSLLARRSSGGSKVRGTSGGASAKEGAAPTPPPPPPPPHRDRERGGSRGSLDAPTSGARSVSDGDGATSIASNSGGTGGAIRIAAGEQPPGSASAAGDLLADLTALQREVDALRGQYESADGASGQRGVGP